MNRKITLRSLTTAILFLFFAFPSWGQIIYFHDFETGTISGKHYSGAPATLASNLLNSSWTTSYDNGFTSYSGKSGQALGLGSINGNRIINLTFDVAPGYTCNITSFNFWRQRSNTAPETITMTINGKSVGEVPNTPTSGSNIGTTNIVDFNNLTGTVAIQLSLTGTGGTFRIDDFTLNGFLVFTGVESQQSGYWNDGSTWVGGIVPNLNQTVLINEGHIVHVDGTGIPTRNANTYINGTFQLNTGGWIGGSNQFIYGSNGTLNFNTNGEYGVEANHIYWPSDNGPVHVNVLQGGTDLTGGLLLNNLSRIINGSLNLWSGVRFENGGLIQINGTCQINQGGWVSSPLTYGPNSTLIYNTNTDPYRNGNEWTPTSNPTNVILNGNTILNYPVIGPEERSISGSLTIEAGSALYMDYDSVNVNSLTIGDLFLSGNLSLGTNPGGDLKTTGNLHFSPGSNFNSNNRAIFFIKDGIQTINNTSATSLTIPYMVIGKTGGSGTTVQMNADVSISAPNTGNALSFINASDVLDMNHRSLTIGTMGTDNQIIGPGSFRGSQTSKLILTGNGDIGTIRFSGTQELGNLTINRTINLPAVTMGSSLTIHNNLTLTNGHITLGANNFQIQPAATITGGGVNSYIRANGTGKLIRYFNTKNQPINLPVGGLQYSPVNYEITEGNLVNNATFLSINLAENKHTQNNSSTSYLNRFWNVSVAGLTTYKADAQFYYNPADVTGTEANILSAAYDGALWQMDHPANTTNHFLSFTETDDLNRAFTGGNQFAPLASHRSNYFRSRSSGDWTTSGTWESSYDNGVWFNATFYPTALANNILIRNTHTVTLNQATTVKRLTIESGGTLTNSGPSGGFDLTIAGDGTSDPAFKIYGTYLLFGKQPVFQPSATARVYANGLVRADDNNGGQSENFASNTNVMFESNAVFEWNIEKPFKTSGVTYFPNSLPTDIPVFKVSKNPGSVGTGILTINGILNVNTDFTFIGGSNKTFRNGIVGNSTLTQNSTGGNRFTINGSNAILGGNNLRINLSNQMYLESSVTVLKDSIVAISGATLNNNTVGNIFSIEGTLDVTDITITNTTGKTITVAKTGTYRTAHPGGFSGGGSSIPSTDGIVSLQPGSTVEFYRNGNQDFDKRDDFSNLIFSGSGIKRASSGFVPVGTITIKENAILDSRGRNIGNSQTNLRMTDNSRFIVSSTGRNPEIDGVYNLLGGVIQFDNSSGTKQTIRGTTSLPAAGSPVVYNQIEVTGTNVGIGSGNINLRDGGKFTVKSGGVFEVNQRAIKGEPGNGSQQVIVENGAHFKTGSKLGFHGLESGFDVSSIHYNITNIDLQLNSSVHYYREDPKLGDGNQTITATVPYQHLIISGNQEKAAQLDGVIEIKGNLSKPTNAIFKHNNSTVIFNGSGIQNYTSAVPQMVFNNLHNRNKVGLNIQDSLFIFRELSMGDQSKLNLQADITLQSNSNNTANVAPIPVNATIAYDDHHRFIVERYIPNHPKAWQFISAPIHGDQTIHQSWQEGMTQGMNEANNAPGAPGNLKPGYGTTITSDRSTWESDGFDHYTKAGSSLKTFNSVEGKWEGVSSTHIPVQNPKGYMLMVRGDRSVIVYNQAATATTLRTRGKIHDPSLLPTPITIPHTPGLFVSVGNPYPSAINFNDLNKSNLGEAYIIWDPQLTNGPHSQYGLGAYRTISGNVVVPSSDNYLDGNIPPIQSGQAFFVQLAENAPAAGFLSFSENAKTSGSRSIFRGQNGVSPNAHLRVNLYVHRTPESVLVDGSMTQFHPDYDRALDKLDAPKQLNSGENWGIMSNYKTLAIERRPIFNESDTLFYTVSGLKKQQYELEYITSKMDISGLEAYVEDIYLNKKTLLNPSGSTMVPFDVNNDSLSYNRNRFRVVFMRPEGPLPVTLIHFSAQMQHKGVAIKWVTENELSIQEYVVEKSGDGMHFYSIQKANAKNRAANNYESQDKEPAAGNNYYRLKIVHHNGKIEYSEIEHVVGNNEPSNYSMMPNPIVNGVVNVQFINQMHGNYQLRLTNIKGQLISMKSIYYKGENNLKLFNINSLADGIYYLEIINPENETNVLKVIK